MRRAALGLACGFCVSGTVLAQTRLNINYCEGRPGLYYFTAELVNPEHDILAVVSDFAFHVDGVNIRAFTYNPAFDSELFGDADVEVTSTTIDFRGSNVIPPLNNADGPDSSNPLYLFTIELEEDGVLSSFEVEGLFSGAYATPPGGQFPIVFLYQHSNGNPGQIPFRLENIHYTCGGMFCYADINGDGVLTPDDFTAWLAEYNAGSSRCDQNFDGDCTPADFTAWVSLYQLGCIL